MALTYLATIRVKPEHFGMACDAVAGIVARTRQEAGCERFDPHPAADGTPTLYIYERWVDQAGYDEHHAQAYTRAVFKSYEEWLAGPVEMTQLADGLE